MPQTVTPEPPPAPPTRRRLRDLWLPAVVILAIAGLVVGLAAHRSAARPARSIRVGSRTLTRCGRRPVTYCGTLQVPLDYDAPSSPRITIAYRWYPAADRRSSALGTVVPVEGGPGYSSIASAPDYRDMYGPLLDRFNMLVVDNRGTGESEALDCGALQGFTGPTASPAYARAVDACGADLADRWHGAAGRPLPASDLFSSVDAGQDMASLIRDLGLKKINLYGDSYGSFYAQVFAAHHPELIRSLILDSTYPVVDSDPWYRASIEAMPGDFDAVCRRSPACAAAAPGPSWARLSALAERLRHRPIAGEVPGFDGSLTHVTMNVVGLVDLLSDAAGDPGIYRGIDAAARALLTDGDPRPLLRLYDQRLVFEDYGQIPADAYSAGLYLAVACTDYAQVFDMSARPAVRSAQFARARAALPAGTFAPFTPQEWTRINQNTEAYSACLRWPAPPQPSAPVSHTPLLPGSLPVLVLGGELDTWTPPSEVTAAVLPRLGGHSRFIKIVNATHVVGEGSTACASALVRGFVADPRRLDSLNDRCAGTLPPIRAVGVYAARLAEQPALAPDGGPPAPVADRRLAAAAVATAGDAVARYEAIDGDTDHGLYGGTVGASRRGTRLTLHADELIPGVAVSGTVTLGGRQDEDTATARLHVTAAGSPPASISASWPLTGPDVRIAVTGQVGPQAVSGTMPAP